MVVECTSATNRIRARGITLRLEDNAANKQADSGLCSITAGGVSEIQSVFIFYATEISPSAIRRATNPRLFAAD
jgi:hypothetical protein